MRAILALLLLCAAAGASPADIYSVERGIFEGTNRFRHEQGLGAVKNDVALDKVARTFATYLAATDRFDHHADGSSPSKRALAGGYDYCVVSENIAFEYDSRGFTSVALAQGLVQGWKDSPGHRRNMLDPKVIDTGIAVVQSPRTGRFYAVQMFGRRRAACR
ncbi:MAG TPA: CAP domain-containing protein [Usitatibacter sp.]|nr:CAP domain-containing protein [Usitatibacter sp.]